MAFVKFALLKFEFENIAPIRFCPLKSHPFKLLAISLILERFLSL